MRRLVFRFLTTFLTFGAGIIITSVLSLYPEPTRTETRASAQLVSVNLSEVKAQDYPETRTAVAQTVASLKQIKVMNGSGCNIIPPTAKPLLTTLKHQLRDLVYERLKANYHQLSPQSLKTEIINLLRADGVSVEEPEEAVVDDNYLDEVFTYGDIYNISLEKPLRHPDLLALTTTLGVCCGNDTSLYLFKDDGKQWKLIMAQESNNYDEVSGAQGGFQYAISPPDKQNKYFVVTANVNPWCTSNWQSLRYQVLRPGKSAEQPLIILSKKNSIFLRDAPLYILNVQTNGFSLRFDDETTWEDDSSGKRIVQYKIDGERARPISK